MTDERKPPAPSGADDTRTGRRNAASTDGRRPAGQHAVHTDGRQRPQPYSRKGDEADKRFGNQRGKRPASDGRPGDGQPGEDRKPRGAAAALIELDRELMKLLVRRATLVSRIRGGKDHAATPAAIQAEKAVRVAWETGALAFSKDPRFVRQLFSLLQDIKVLTKEQADNSGIFNLTPARSPFPAS